MFDGEFDIKKEFLDEAGELLDSAEKVFMAMEKNPSDRNLLDQIFRLAHTIKGSGKAAGFPGITALAHGLENLLSNLRSGETEITPGIIDLLLHSNDILCDYVNLLRGNYEAILDTSEIEEALHQATRTSKGEGSIKPKASGDQDRSFCGLHIFDSEPEIDISEKVEKHSMLAGRETIEISCIDRGKILLSPCIQEKTSKTICQAIEQIGSYEIVKKRPEWDDAFWENEDFVLTLATIDTLDKMPKTMTPPSNNMIIAIGVPATGKQWAELIDKNVGRFIPNTSEVLQMKHLLEYALETMALRRSSARMEHLCAKVHRNAMCLIIDSHADMKNPQESMHKEMAECLDQMDRIVNQWRNMA